MHKYALCIFCLTTALDFAWGVLRGARLTFIVGGTLDHAARCAGMRRRCELRGARAWGRGARFPLEVKKKLPKPAAETSTRCAKRGSFSRFDPDRGGRDGWKLKRNFQTGRRKLPRGARCADRLAG
jgi:hypothetical protein